MSIVSDRNSGIPSRGHASSCPELAVAALTALRAYIWAGKSRGPERALLGSFEDWDRLVYGCLMWLGFADPVVMRQQVSV